MMIGLHGNLKKIINIIEEGSDKIGLYEEPVGSKLNYEFGKIVQDVAALLASKKLQFLEESSLLFN